jgi:hypothetical protein
MQRTVQPQVTCTLPNEPIHQVVVVRALQRVTQDSQTHWHVIIAASEAAGDVVT